jgi:hypothetical protein
LTSGLRTAAHAPVVESEFDGAAEFWVASLEDFGAIFADEHYQSTVVPDEESFLNRAEGVVYVGEEQLKWEGGKPAAGVSLEK